MQSIGKVVVFFVFITFVSAASAKADGKCSLASLKGIYAIQRQGTVVAQLPGFPPPPLPFAEVTIATFDGAGSAKGKYTVNIGGIVFDRHDFTATYTVEQDCTGTATIDPGLGFMITENIIVLDAGKRVLGIQIDPSFEVIHSITEKLTD